MFVVLKGSCMKFIAICFSEKTIENTLSSNRRASHPEVFSYLITRILSGALIKRKFESIGGNFSRPNKRNVQIF